MDYIKIGQYISKKRKEKNLTQKELAAKLQVTDKAVSKWETGSSLPDISLLAELANVLDITVDELIHGEENHQRKIHSEQLTIHKNMHKKALRHFMFSQKKIVIGILIILSILLLFGGIALYQLSSFSNLLYYGANKWTGVLGSISIQIAVALLFVIVFYYGYKVYRYKERESNYSYTEEGLLIDEKLTPWSNVRNCTIDDDYVIIHMKKNDVFIQKEDYKKIKKYLNCKENKIIEPREIFQICCSYLMIGVIIISTLLEIGYHFILRRHGFEFIYPQIESFLLALIVCLVFLNIYRAKIKKNKQLLCVSLATIITLFAVWVIVGIVSPIHTIVSMSPDYSKIFILKHNQNTNEVWEYHSQYLMFTIPNDSFHSKGNIDIKWLTNDCVLATYQKLDDTNGLYIGTYGTRSSNESYFDVLEVLEGEWISKNKPVTTLSVTKKEIIFNKEKYEMKDIQQYEKSVLLLSKNNIVKYVVALNPNCVISEKGLLNTDGTISLYDMKKDVMIEMKSTTNQEKNEKYEKEKNQIIQRSLMEMNEIVSEIERNQNVEFLGRKDLFMIQSDSSNYEEIVGLAMQKIHQLNNEDVLIEKVTLNVRGKNLEDFYVECHIAGKQKVDLSYYGYEYEKTHFLRFLKTKNGYLVKEFESDLIKDLYSSLPSIQKIEVSNLDYFYHIDFFTTI